MSIDDYLELVQAARQGGMGQFDFKPVRKVKGPKKPKRTGKKDPKMAKALRKANQIGRTKAGKLRKGYTQARIMKKAHQLRRKM